MTHYSSCLTNEQIGLLLAAIEQSAYRSRRDGCRVAMVKCTKCGRAYEEELGAARQMLRDRDDFLCLGCDPQASAPGFTGVNVRIGWY